MAYSLLMLVNMMFQYHKYIKFTKFKLFKLFIDSSALRVST